MPPVWILVWDRKKKPNGWNDPLRKVFELMASIRPDEVTIRLLREEDLPALEWDGEYKRYRRIYREVFRNSQIGISFPLVAETRRDGIIGQVFLNQKEPNPKFTLRSRYYFLSSFREYSCALAIRSAAAI